MTFVYTLAEHENKSIFPKMLNESLGTIAKVNPASIKVLNESVQGKPKKLIVTMEAIHVGRTRNYTFYTKEGLMTGLSSWTSPHQKPVLTHHNDRDGEPIGRIIKAEFAEVTQSGKPGLVFTVEITDPVAMEKVMDGRYQTVSIGANTDKITCNICGTDRTQEWCEHYPGTQYEDQVAHLIIGTTLGREVSYVNTPADEYAGNTGIQIVNEGDDPDVPAAKTSSESVHMNIFQLSENDMRNANDPSTNLYPTLNENAQSFFNQLLIQEGGSQMPTTPPVPTTPPAVTPTADPVTPAAGTTTENTQQAPVATGQENPVAQTNTPASNTATPVVNVNESATITALQEAMSRLVLEGQQKDTRLAEAQQETTRLLEENARLNTEAHTHLVEKVVDLKRKLNKPEVVGVEESACIETHASRSKESLDNTYSDLLAEYKALKPEPGSITNPGIVEEGAQGGTGEVTPKKQMTLDEATKLLTGMFGSHSSKRN